MFTKFFTRHTAALFTLVAIVLTGLSAQGAVAARRRRVSKYKWEVKGKVNINKANLKKLRCLPGIGASKARSIIARRKKKPFTTVAQLRAIRGIGTKLLARIRPYVTLSGATTISRKRVRRPRKE